MGSEERRTVTGCPQCGSTDLQFIEVRGEYDGILVMGCNNCDHLWPRFSRQEWQRLHDRALEIIANYRKTHTKEAETES
jgi:hypothetical protein